MLNSFYIMGHIQLSLQLSKMFGITVSEKEFNHEFNPWDILLLETQVQFQQHVSVFSKNSAVANQRHLSAQLFGLHV